jgi:hypothetical protein
LQRTFNDATNFCGIAKREGGFADSKKNKVATNLQRTSACNEPATNFCGITGRQAGLLRKHLF